MLKKSLPYHSCQVALTCYDTLQVISGKKSETFRGASFQAFLFFFPVVLWNKYEPHIKWMCCNTTVEASAKVSYLERLCNTKFVKKNYFSPFWQASRQQRIILFLRTFFATSVGVGMYLRSCQEQKRTAALPSFSSWWDIKPVGSKCWPLWERSGRFKATGSHQRVIAEPLPSCSHLGKLVLLPTPFSPHVKNTFSPWSAPTPSLSIHPSI